MFTKPSEITKLLLAFLSVYPLALLTYVVLEHNFGDVLFAYDFLYNSKRWMLDLLLTDWLMSSVVVIPVLVISVSLLKLAANRFAINMILVCAVIAFVTPFLIHGIPNLLGFVLAYALLVSLFVTRVHT